MIMVWKMRRMIITAWVVMIMRIWKMTWETEKFFRQQDT